MENLLVPLYLGLVRQPPTPPSPGHAPPFIMKRMQHLLPPLNFLLFVKASKIDFELYGFHKCCFCKVFLE